MGPASWLCALRTMQALSLVEISAVAILKFIIILPLNLCFIHESAETMEHIVSRGDGDSMHGSPVGLSARTR